MPYISSKDAITNLQRYLRQLSYTDADIPSPPVDGIFESVTKNSLLAFQKKYGLPQSGVGDRATWDKLYAEYLASIARYSPPRALSVFPRVPEGYAVSRGDEYFLVGIIQLLLNELQIIYDSFIPLSMNGIFDEPTEKNIIDFQKKNHLPAMGKVDKATWDSLVRAYAQYAADYVR
ncbi:MAG: hypothetical protein E7679_01745 [Ruminococcaceae bacterium]|nr:hypothetical protein [Oscillospiraceae bacterium]